jgi:hypothetical protein
MNDTHGIAAEGGGQLIAMGGGVWIVAKVFTNEDFTAVSRMAVVELSGGRLVIHSPVALDPALRRQVESLGKVTAIIAPNRWHHQFVGEWRTTFPDAVLFGCPALFVKRPDLAFDRALTDAPPSRWAGEIDQVAVRGLPTGEFIFFHRRSRTILVGDLAFNYSPAQAALDPGAAEGLGPHERHRRTITDADALAQTVERILQWDFDRVVVSHGEVVNQNGRELFAAGFAFLKQARR